MFIISKFFTQVSVEVLSKVSEILEPKPLPSSKSYIAFKEIPYGSQVAQKHARNKSSKVASKQLVSKTTELPALMCLPSSFQILLSIKPYELF